MKMKYRKPELVVHGERDVAEWATPQKEITHHFPAVACKCTMGQSKAMAPQLDKLRPSACHCTMGQARAMTPPVDKLRPVACHCANGGSRVTYKVQASPVQDAKAA
ncbi:MAG: hypothetical protein LBI42_05165 [Chitinispirillales bacterium]|jgi:hypothetical protein|nr:hypothetical protein [Chitinispirillales bacterium]